VSGFEPLTVRLQGASGPSAGIADRGSICRLAAIIIAGDSPASLGCCLRWLPVWLPEPNATASHGKENVAHRIALSAPLTCEPAGVLMPLPFLSECRLLTRPSVERLRRAHVGARMLAVATQPTHGFPAHVTDGGDRPEIWHAISAWMPRRRGAADGLYVHNWIICAGPRLCGPAQATLTEQWTHDPAILESPCSKLLERTKKWPRQQACSRALLRARYMPKTATGYRK
jgi:hypothetical protein